MEERLAKFSRKEGLVGYNLKILVQIHNIDIVNDPGQQNGVEGKRRYPRRPPQTETSAWCPASRIFCERTKYTGGSSESTN